MGSVAIATVNCVCINIEGLNEGHMANIAAMYGVIREKWWGRRKYHDRYTKEIALLFDTDLEHNIHK